MRTPLVFLLSVTLAAAALRVAGGEASPEVAYVLSIECAGTMHTPPATDNKLSIKSEIHYRCISRGELLAMYQLSHAFKRSVDGRLLEESTATKDKLIRTTPSGRQELTVANSKQEFRD